jgi:phosphoribosylglycinamide formyltransferase-1
MAGELKLAVLVSGRGSNLRALLEAIERRECKARVACVVSDRDGAAALDLARARAIPTATLRPKDFGQRAEWDAALAACVAGFAPELVVLAGFMRIVGPALLAAFPARIINVHPALLPAFPGADAPAQAVKSKVALSGCTVHVVDAGVDTGPVLAQAAVPVLPSDDAASLHARIQVAEHKLLPRVVDAIARGHYELGNPPRYRGPCEDAGAAFYCWPPLS